MLNKRSCGAGILHLGGFVIALLFDCDFGWRIVVADWDDIVVRRAMTLDRIALALDERRALLRSA